MRQDGRIQLLEFFVATLLLSLLITGTGTPLKAASGSPTIVQEFLNDSFDNGLAGWTYFGDTGYQLTLDITTGQPAPSAHISGDAWLSECSIHGMSKVVTISNLTGPLILSVNYRAASDISDVTTNAEVNVVDPATNAVLFTHRLVNGGTTDSGWQSYSMNIATSVNGKSRIVLEFNLYDCWSADWHENNWYDNVRLYETTTYSAPPGAPTNLSASPVSSTQIALSWSAPSNNGGSPIIGYRVERSADNGATWSIVTNTGNGTAYTDGGLARTTTYTYRVSALNLGNNNPSAPSNTASATTPYATISVWASWMTCCYGDAQFGGQTDSAPVQLKVYAPDNELILNRTITSSGYFGGNFACQRSQGKGNYVIVASYAGKVSAQFELGSWINNDPVVYISQALENTDGSVWVNGRVANGIAGEQVSVSVHNSTGSTTATVVTGTNTHAQFQTSIGQTAFPTPGNYTIVVTHLPTGVTGSAVLAYAYLPSAPTGLTATAVSSSQISLSWNAPSSNGGSPISRYDIYRSATSGGEGIVAVATVSGSTLTYTDGGLTSGQAFYYTVRAVNSVGASPPSNEASATTLAPVIVLNGVAATSGTVSVPPYQVTLPSFNAGTGDNRLLVVGVEANNNNVASVTFGGVALTRVASSFHNNDAEFWYLENPVGTADIVVTMVGPTSVVVGAYSFSGVDQANPIPTNAATYATGAGSPAISIATQYRNSWVLDLPSIWGGVTLGSPSCTQQWDVNLPNRISGASSSKITSTPGQVTCSWTASGGGDLWDDIAIELKASGS